MEKREIRAAKKELKMKEEAERAEVDFVEAESQLEGAAEEAAEGAK